MLVSNDAWPKKMNEDKIAHGNLTSKVPDDMHLYGAIHSAICTSSAIYPAICTSSAIYSDVRTSTGLQLGTG